MIVKGGIAVLANTSNLNTELSLLHPANVLVTRLETKVSEVVILFIEKVPVTTFIQVTDPVVDSL